MTRLLLAVPRKARIPITFAVVFGPMAVWIPLVDPSWLLCGLAGVAGGALADVIGEHWTDIDKEAAK